MVIGKHQNAFQEINPKVLATHGLPLLRRISGGGAVYHDLGNINFSVISESPNARLIDFQLVLAPLVRVLCAMGLPVRLRGKSDLFLGDAKISGNAIYAWRNRVLHHGTLLYDANLNILQAVLDATRQPYESRAIKSNRSPVTNLRGLMPGSPPVESFIKSLMEGVEQEWPSAAGWGDLTAGELAQAERLCSEKYSTWDWNYGRSPAYTLRRKHGSLEICLDVRGGEIQRAEFTGLHGSDNMAKALIGVEHRRDAVTTALQPFESDMRLHALSLAKVLEALF